MPKEHRFFTSNKFGKQGEQEVLEYIRKKESDIKSIQDVSSDPEYQKKDIDAIVHFNNGEQWKIEIKTDSHPDTGNIVFEAWSSVEDKNPGCMYITECDYLYYYFPASGELIRLKMEPYRKWVEVNLERGNFNTVYVKNSGWGITYNSLNYLIPKKMLKSTFKDIVFYDTKLL